MRADVNLDPDGLRAVAAVVAGLVDDLCPLPPRLPDVPSQCPDRAAVAAELGRLCATAERAAAELTTLSEGVRVAATAAEHADLDLARALRRSAGDVG